MALRVVHLFGSDDGETHFGDLTLEADSRPPGSTVSVFTIPTLKITYAEYPDDQPNREVIPGFHATPSRHFITPLRGAFEVTTTTGESRQLHQGDWILFDDIGSKGHLTKRIGSDRRVNLVIEIADGWTLPSSSGATSSGPRR